MAPRRRREDTLSTWRRYEPAGRWIALIVIALVLASLFDDQRKQAARLKTAIERLDARQNALCVAVRKGRVVFKKVVDENGLYVGTRVTLIDCPAPVLHPKGTK